MYIDLDWKLNQNRRILSDSDISIFALVLKIDSVYTGDRTEGAFHADEKHYLYFDEAEYSILVKSLVQMKNKLIQEGRFTDCVDDLIMKVIVVPMKII